MFATDRVISSFERVIRSSFCSAKRFNVLRADPWKTPPSFERLVVDLGGAISRRINIQHRLVYQVLESEEVIKVLRLWTHYE